MKGDSAGHKQVDQRQVDRERAALARCALHIDRADEIRCTPLPDHQPPGIPGRPSRISASVLRHRHALLGQFLLRLLVLGEVRQAHPTQHVGGLGELDVVVADDLDAVTPGIAKIEEGPANKGDTCCIERLAGRLLVIHHTRPT
jgi:hypothetical protein